MSPSLDSDECQLAYLGFRLVMQIPHISSRIKTCDPWGNLAHSLSYPARQSLLIGMQGARGESKSGAQTCGVYTPGEESMFDGADAVAKGLLRMEIRPNNIGLFNAGAGHGEEFGGSSLSGERRDRLRELIIVRYSNSRVGGGWREGS